jgi:hypothetical protein
MDLKPQGGDVILLLGRIGLLGILQGGHVRLILVSSYWRGCMELLFMRNWNGGRIKRLKSGRYSFELCNQIEFKKLLSNCKLM